MIRTAPLLPQLDYITGLAEKFFRLRENMSFRQKSSEKHEKMTILHEIYADLTRSRLE